MKSFDANNDPREHLAGNRISTEHLGDAALFAGGCLTSVIAGLEEIILFDDGAGLARKAVTAGVLLASGKLAHRGYQNANQD